MQIKNKCLSPVAVPKVTGHKIPVFRCGKCPNCLKQKANELAVRSIREVNYRPIGWITLTYDNENCPIRVDELSVDAETGEYKHSQYIKRDSSFFDEAKFKWIKHYKKGRMILTKRYEKLEKVEEVYEGDLFNPKKCLRSFRISKSYMSVYYDDVKKFIKRHRENFGSVNCFSNKYICVPEYGAAGYRPHYHLMVIDPSDKEIEYIRSNWFYGDVDVDLSTKVSVVNKIATYLSKYASKGKYDCPYIAEGLVLKPRRSSSVGFGVGDIDDLKQRLLSTNLTHIDDTFFNYDCPPVINERLLSLLQRNRAYKVANIETGEVYNYPFPKYLVDKVFKKRFKVVSYYERVWNNDLPFDKYDISQYFQSSKFYEIDSKEQRAECNRFVAECKKRGCFVSATYKVISSPLQVALKNYLLADVVDNYLRQCEQEQRFIKDSGDVSGHYKAVSDNGSLAFKSAEEQFKYQLISSSIF